MLFFCGLLSILTLKAQVFPTARFEAPLNVVDFDSYRVIPLNENGLLLYRRVMTKEGPNLEMIRVDTTLHQVWRGYAPLEPNYVVQQATRNNDYVYILLRNTHNAIGNFLVLAVQSVSGSYQPYPIDNLIRFTPREFVVTSTAFLIGGYFNYRPIILYYGIGRREARVLPGFLNDVGELMQIQPYENGSVDIIVGARNSEKQRCLWIRNFDALGNLAKTIVLEPGPRKNLIFGQAVKMPGEDQVVAGVYGRFTDYSRGVFVAKINPEGEYQINYYNFGDLQNFFNFMKASRVKRIKERIERRKIKGKKIKFNYRILVHAIVPDQDQYILLGEAFYPTYKYTSYGSGMGIYTPYRNDLIFDGYKYTHAVMIGFTREGKLLWDNSFEINDIKSFQLEQFVKIHPEKNRIVLLYLFQNIIRSKIINHDKVLEGKTYESLRGMKDGSTEIGFTESSKLEYWYGKNFYVSGIQYVRSGDPNAGNSGKVFFITKVTYP